MKQPLASDRFWLLAWIFGLAAMMAWDSAYLNAPAFVQVQEAFEHSMLAGLLVVLLSLFLGWAAALLLYYGEDRRAGWVRVIRFFLDLIRSMPQIVGLLTGYVLLTIFLERGIITTQTGQILWTSFVVSIFLFIEVVDVITERIHHYAASDFVPAMLGCGIGEWRIVNVEILWRNCRAHLLNKAVSVFGMAIFLQCSVDFVVSVGLSTDVSLTNVPMTLGSLLAKMDSKQDILAMGIVFSDPSYLPNLFIRHLQGLSTAFFIVFTLLCVARISEGIARRVPPVISSGRPYSIRIAAGRNELVSIDEFFLQEGKITFLFGESGIGKSLISKAVYGLLDPEELTVSIDGAKYRDYLRRSETQAMQENGFFVFQEPSTHLNPLMRLEEQLREGSLSAAPSETSILSRLWDTTSYRSVSELLRVYPKPDRPSGGEKQRVLLTMAFKKIALLKNFPARSRNALFVFDEPSGNLDNHFRDQFLNLLCEYHAQMPFTAVVITHDYSMITSLQRHQRHMLGSVSFREIYRKRSRLGIRDFAPALYTEWADSLRSAAPPRQWPPPILEFESGASVYGKTLVISKDPGGADPCALSIAPGMIAALKAPSGTGKTTVVKMMMGMSPVAQFSMTFCGESLSDRTPRSYWRDHLWGKMMTMVFQHADEALNPNASVEDVFHRIPESAIRELVDAWFPDTADDAFLKKQISYLSGGEKQRLNLLRSLSLQTDLLILDEPLNGLDFESMTRVLAMLKTNQRKAQAVLIISHNDDVFDRLVPASQTYYLHAL